MKSMTGHGRAEVAHGGCRVTVEMSSVNRKQGDVSVSLPRELEVLEGAVREEVMKSVSRGRLTVKITVQDGDGSKPSRARVNLELARSYERELRRLAKLLKLEGGVSLEVLARAPGVLEVETGSASAEDLWPAIRTALIKALAGLVKMREREGAHLKAELKRRGRLMEKAVERVRQRAPSVQLRYRDQLRERIATAGLNLSLAPLEEERLHREVAIFADRSDITEELTRLASHFQQYYDVLEAAEPAGRTLDFLLQEMNREVNTIGSKANDSLISRDVVEMKSELERIREQVQNVE